VNLQDPQTAQNPQAAAADVVGNVIDAGVSERLACAAEAMGHFSDAEASQRLAEFHRARASRTQQQISRQQAELVSMENDAAAYHLAAQTQCEGLRLRAEGRWREGDDHLRTAVRWYRAAALNDYADASLRLADVLDALATAARDRPEPGTGAHDELALVCEAAQWYAVAYAATGDVTVVDALDELIVRHDPRRKPTLQPQTDTATAQPQSPQPAASETSESREAPGDEAQEESVGGGRA
jgi:hypothetical protein